MCFCCLTECCCAHAPNTAWLTATDSISLGSDVTFSRKPSEPDYLVSYCLFALEALVITLILTFIATSCGGHMFVSISPHSWRAEL